MPVTPQNAAGIRIEPAVSVPSVPGTSPAATAAPLPPLEPPQIRSVSHGLRAGPKAALVVEAPKANSCVLSLPTMIAPARRSRATTMASCRRDVVGEHLRGGGRPRAGDVDHVLHRERHAVQWAARRRPARPPRRATPRREPLRNELKAPSSRSMRSSAAWTASRGESSPRRIAAASSATVTSPPDRGGTCRRVGCPARSAPRARAASEAPSRGSRARPRGRRRSARRPAARARARSSASDGSGVESLLMPIYEYRCEGCGERFEEFLSLSTKPAPPCPKCGAEKAERLLSRINTEWLPSDVAWDRVGRTWD